MSITYNFTFGQFISLDPGLTEPNGTTLQQEIVNAGLVGFLTAFIYPSTMTVDLVFSAAVSVVVLTSVVQAHTGLDGSGFSPDHAPPVQASQIREQPFTPSNGQITFLLSTAPINNISVDFIVNGAEYPWGTCFTVSGQTVTWLNVPFAIESTDSVIIKYIENA